MTKRRLLPSADGEAVRMDRRGLFALGCAACALAACDSLVPADGGAELGEAGTDASVDDAGDDDASTDAGGDASSDDTSDGTSANETCTNGIDVGPVEMFALGTWTKVTAVAAIVGHDDNGLFAYSAICTHFGVQLPAPTETPNGMRSVCPVSMGGHGSTFDGNGQVLVGPATMPLPHFALAVCDGRVVVDVTRRVAASTRTPLS